MHYAFPDVAATESISLASLIEQIIISQRLTRSEELRLVAAMSSCHLLADDLRIMLQRVLYGMRHGLLTLVE